MDLYLRAFFFLLLITLIFLCTSFMLLCENTMYSVFLVILIFILYSHFLMILKLEFFSVIFMFIYLGGLLVLYLFVVAFIGTKAISENLKKKNSMTSAINVFFGFLFVIQSLFVSYSIFSDFQKPCFVYFFYIDFLSSIYYSFPLNILGLLIYDYYPVALLLGSLILLVAMFCAIILTMPYKNKIQYKLNK